MRKMLKIGTALVGVVLLAGCGQAQTTRTQPLPVPGSNQNGNSEPVVEMHCENFPDPNTFCPNGTIIKTGTDNKGCSIYDCESSQAQPIQQLTQSDVIDVEKIDRRIGEKCATSGPDERYNNLPQANGKYAYTDPLKSMTLEIPYNNDWKFYGCEIGPFTQFPDGNGVLVYFGQPSSWGPDQYQLRIGQVRSIEDIQKELLTGPEDSSLPRQQMKKITINGLEAFRLQENGLGEMVKIEVIGKKYNYRFESGVSAENELIKIIKSLKFL